MLELGVFCVILVVIGYWTTLFVMGRRNDVLHGEFLETKLKTAPLPPIAATPFTLPVSIAQSAPTRTASVPMPAFPTLSTPLPPPAADDSPPANTEALQSLLVSLKQELKNAAQI